MNLNIKHHLFIENLLKEMIIFVFTCENSQCVHVRMCVYNNAKNIRFGNMRFRM